ncbi:MAG: gliding motility-associated C-terminal domain-containing protein, partial [Sediminibacterium sp.]
AACTNQFTQGQAERMHAAINTQRGGLLSNLITKPCTENVLASYTRSIADPKIGETITFNNTSSNGVSYEWLVDGALVSVATDLPARSFAVTGVPPFTTNKHSVTLKAYKNGCMSAYTDYILVNCGLTARFSNNKRFIASQTNILNDTILFTNNSMSTLGGTTSYEWILTNTTANIRQTVITNAAGGLPDDLNYIFPTPGNYTMRLKATNGGCVDSSDALFFTVADPRQDAYMSVIGANCFQDTKLWVSFFVCNFGYAPILPNLPVSFYDDDPTKPGARQIGTSFIVPDSLKGFCCGRVYVDTLNVGYEKLNKVYAVANNVTVTVPIVLPDPAVTLLEKDYKNNISSFFNFRFKASVTPTVAVMEPGDTLQLKAQGSPDAGISYAWTPPGNMSCTTCSSPFVYADTNALTTKRVIVKSSSQCTDTAYVDIKVPPYNDYAVTINAVLCSPKEDSLTIDFTVKNLFKKGIIPKNLQVAFYKDDPQTAVAVLLPPVFKVPDSVLAKQQTYRYKIKKIRGGTLFASVNDNGSSIPVLLANAPFLEKLYTNNFTSFNYQLISGTLDTAICSGETFAGHNVSGTYSDTLLTAGGCDSVRVLRLTVKTAAVTRTTLNITICEGLSYAGHTTSGTYIDTYPGTNTCDSIRTVNLTVNPVVRKIMTVNICKGNNYFAAGKLQTQTGVYIDSAKSSKGCDSITTTNLFVNPIPAGFLPRDTSLCPDKTLTINLSNYSTVSWSTGSTSSSLSVTQSGIYGAQVVDRNGCTGTDSIKVVFEKCIPIQIPTAFTPNNDGKNDVFRPTIGVATSNYTMQIWSRWGQLVFETHNTTVGWNGKYAGEMQPNGAYIYTFSFTDPDGFAVYRRGTFVLIR